MNRQQLLAKYTTCIYVLTKIADFTNKDYDHLVSLMNPSKEELMAYNNIDNAEEAFITMCETHNLYREAAAAIS